jgi:hypothetical protein
MKYAVEMGSVVITYIPSFIKIGWGFTDAQTHRQLIISKQGKQAIKVTFPPALI